MQPNSCAVNALDSIRHTFVFASSACLLHSFTTKLVLVCYILHHKARYSRLLSVIWHHIGCSLTTKTKQIWPNWVFMGIWWWPQPHCLVVLCSSARSNWIGLIAHPLNGWSSSRQTSMDLISSCVTLINTGTPSPHHTTMNCQHNMLLGREGGGAMLPVSVSQILLTAAADQTVQISTSCTE